MKKINMNRLAAALLVLVLLTSCFVGSTMARYATGAEGSDNARAAKFGVEIQAYGTVFADDYEEFADGNDAGVANAANLTVASSGADGDNVVAPGTKGDDVLTFKIEGSTEVAVNVTVTLNNNDQLKMITLPAKDGYTDYTKYTMGTSTENKGSYGTFNQANAYNPIKWTLKKDGNPVPTCNGVTLDAIETYLTSISKKYAPNSAEFNDICGTYTLSWIWEYGEDSPADTYIGMVAAGKQTDTSVLLNETFGFKIYIVQVD